MLALEGSSFMTLLLRGMVDFIQVSLRLSQTLSTEEHCGVGWQLLAEGHRITGPHSKNNANTQRHVLFTDTT